MGNFLNGAEIRTLKNQLEQERRSNAQTRQNMEKQIRQLNENQFEKEQRLREIQENNVQMFKLIKIQQEQKKKSQAKTAQIQKMKAERDKLKKLLETRSTQDSQLKRAAQESENLVHQMQKKLENQAVKSKIQQDKIKKKIRELQIQKKRSQQRKDQIQEIQRKLQKSIYNSRIQRQKLQETDNQLRRHKADLKVISEKYNKQSSELKELKDPKKIVKAENQLFNNFLGQLSSFDVYHKIPKKDNLKYIVIIGEISSGKSTIYNWLFDLKLKFGAGEVTQQINIIHHVNNYTYFDSPGLTQGVNITNADFLQAFYGCDYVFIATDRSLKNVSRCIQVMDKINPPKLFLLRTQCDKFSDQQLEGERARDQRILQEWNINRPILYISAHKKDQNYKDNGRFKSEILPQKQQTNDL